MAEPITSTDAVYENSLREAERVFYFASVDWQQRGTEQVSSIPKQVANIIAEVAATVWSEELKPPKPKGMNTDLLDLVLALVVLCHRYGEAELRAFAELLHRQGVPPSRAVKRLDKHAEVTLADIRKRKWNPQIEMFVGLFNDDPFIGQSWLSVEERIRESVRDDLHGWIWFHQEGWDGQVLNTNPPTARKATKPIRRGYRKKVREWMEREDLESVEQAAP